MQVVVSSGLIVLSHVKWSSFLEVLQEVDETETWHMRRTCWRARSRCDKSAWPSARSSFRKPQRCNSRIVGSHPESNLWRTSLGLKLSKSSRPRCCVTNISLWPLSNTCPLLVVRSNQCMAETGKTYSLPSGKVCKIPFPVFFPMVTIEWAY